jgi:hypothetical protein
VRVPATPGRYNATLRTRSDFSNHQDSNGRVGIAAIIGAPLSAALVYGALS